MYEVDIQTTEDITADEIENLQRLYHTPIGSIPMERDKGIDTSCLSMSGEAVKSILSVEIIKKTRKYSNLEVTSVDMEIDSKGKILVKVVVARGE